MDLYGIKNCNTVKKALNFLEENQIPYVFHDYKKEAPTEEMLRKAIEKFGWDVVINRKGTTWRQLDDKTKESMDEKGAIKIAIEKPSIIKRPLVIVDGEMKVIGFDESEYSALL